ncbi:hypothetical protein NMG60_11020368 [Bertholletia excelsa]
MISTEFLPFNAQFPSKRSLLSENGRSPKWVLPRLVELKKYPKKSRFSSTIYSATGNGGLRVAQQGIGPRDGVIIVDHGSRRKESNLMLDEFVTMFRDKTGYRVVEPAHMELVEPSIRCI